MMKRYALTIVLLLVALGGCDGPDASVGAACIDDRDCRDECLRDWPGGFCTLRCRDDLDCPRDSVCIDGNGGVCMLLCRDSRECRDRLGDNDYKCDDRRREEGGRDDVCVPD